MFVYIYIYIYIFFSWREVGGGEGKKERREMGGEFVVHKVQKVTVNSNIFKRNLLNHSQTSVQKVETAALVIYTCSVVWSPHVCFHLQQP